MINKQQSDYVHTILTRVRINASEDDFFRLVETLTASTLLEQSIQSDSSLQPKQPDRRAD